MNISSVIVRARPEKLAGVCSALARLPGVEVHQNTPDGRVIVTIEDNAESATADAFLAVHNLDGVIGASLVYQYCDDGLEQEAQP